MAVVSPDNTSLWEPSVHRGMNSADPLQRHVDSSFLTESSHPPNERYPLERETVSGETQHDPISILSDGDTTVSASDTDQDDGEDSDSTLPSIRSLVASLPKAPPNNPSRQQHETSANAETDDLAQHPEPPDPVQRSSPSSDAHTVVDHLRPPASLVSSLSEAPGPEQASYTSGDGTPAQAQIHEVQASVNPEQGPVLSEADHIVGAADAEPPHSVGTKRKRSLELSQGMRGSALRENNDEAESGFDSGSSEDTDREDGVLNAPHRLTRTSQKRHKGGQHVVGTKRFRSHSVPTDMDTGSNVVGIQSALPLPGHGKGLRDSTRITPMRRWGSCPAHSVETSLNPSTQPSRPENSLCRGVATFQEWPLSFASLKRVMLGNGRATFQLQFDWDPNIDCEPPERPGSTRHDAPVPSDNRRRNKVTSSRGFTSEENQFLIELKGQKNLRWSEITTKFNKNFPERERSQGYLQVHYSTKLKKRNAR